ncbi:hypothetical protein Efla_007756 [Eimeria flavescens]
MSRDLLFKEAVAAAAGVEETTEVVTTTAAIPAEAKIIKTKTLEGRPGVLEAALYGGLQFVSGRTAYRILEARNWEDWVLDSGN